MCVKPLSLCPTPPPFSLSLPLFPCSLAFNVQRGAAAQHTFSVQPLEMTTSCAVPYQPEDVPGELCLRGVA